MNADALDLLYLDMPSVPDGSVEEAHFFGAGVYVRRSVVPKGQAIRMHVHEYDHLSVVCSGRGRLMTDEKIRAVQAGDVIEVAAGRRHAYLADEDTIWLCIHPVDEEEAQRLYGKNLP